MECTPIFPDYNETLGFGESQYTYAVSSNESSIEIAFKSGQNASNSVSYKVDVRENSVRETYEWLEAVIYSKVIIPVCIFGILGNMVNLLVLTRKGLQKTMDRMERSAHTGLIALAISDMFFCVALVPNAWVEWGRFMYDSPHFDLYYRVYGEGFISMFIMASTWLTVAMATSRYFAICHPLRAREIIGMTFARCSIAIVFVFCIVFNLPRFLRQYVDAMDCAEGHRVYFTSKGYLQTNPVFGTIYLWVYFSIGIVGPLLVLTYCNSHLVRALRRSTAMRQQYRSTSHHPQNESTHRITLTLIIIVVMYILLVSPAEIINFLQKVVIADASLTHSHNLAVAIVNALQAVNFALNFVLYCAINVHFRKTVKELLCCMCVRRKPQRSDTFRSSRTTCYDSVVMTTTMTTTANTGVVNMRNLNSTTV